MKQLPTVKQIREDARAYAEGEWLPAKEAGGVDEKQYWTQVRYATNDYCAGAVRVLSQAQPIITELRQDNHQLRQLSQELLEALKKCHEKLNGISGGYTNDRGLVDGCDSIVSDIEPVIQKAEEQLKQQKDESTSL